MASAFRLRGSIVLALLCTIALVHLPPAVAAAQTDTPQAARKLLHEGWRGPYRYDVVDRRADADPEVYGARDEERRDDGPWRQDWLRDRQDAWRSDVRDPFVRRADGVHRAAWDERQQPRAWDRWDGADGPAGDGVPAGEPIADPDTKEGPAGGNAVTPGDVPAGEPGTTKTGAGEPAGGEPAGGPGPATPTPACAPGGAPGPVGADADATVKAVADMVDGNATLAEVKRGEALMTEATSKEKSAEAAALEEAKKKLEELNAKAAESAKTGPGGTDGPATDGPATDGPATDGPATDGPATDGPGPQGDAGRWRDAAVRAFQAGSKPNGMTCSTAGECASGKCVGSVCSECTKADSAEGCPQGHVCASKAVDKLGYLKCVKRVDLPWCTSNDDCLIGACANVLPSVLSTWGLCSNCNTEWDSSMCGPNMVCRKRKTTVGPFSYTLDAMDCEAKPKLGGECSADANCDQRGGKLYCVLGKCRTCQRAAVVEDLRDCNDAAKQYCALDTTSIYQCEDRKLPGAECCFNCNFQCKNGDCMLVKTGWISWGWRCN